MMVSHKISIESAWDEMKVIRESPPCFNVWIQTLSYPLSGFACALTFFGGSLYDSGIAGLGGLLVGLCALAATKIRAISRFLEFLGAFLVGILTRIVTGSSPAQSCFLAISISALVWFLPGLSITQSVMEIASRSVISGVSRLVYAISVALQLGFGLALGSLVVFWGPSESYTNCTAIDRRWHFLTFFGVAISFNILLNANFSQWPGMTIASGLGLLVSELASSSLDPNLTTMLAALTIGMFGFIMARFSHNHQNALTIVLSGILMLVPGSVGLRGVNALLQNDTVSGTQFGFSMLVVALSIAIGLLVARMCVQGQVRLRLNPNNMAQHPHYNRLRELPPL